MTMIFLSVCLRTHEHHREPDLDDVKSFGGLFISQGAGLRRKEERETSESR